MAADWDDWDDEADEPPSFDDLDDDEGDEADDDTPCATVTQGEPLGAMARAWLDNAARYPLLSLADEQAAGRGERVCRCCKDGREALVCHNLRLIPKTARRYRVTGTSLDVTDLWQYGTLGLHRAARRFDVARGFKFSTYGTWWIRQAITRGMQDEGYTIREPVHVHTTRTRAIKAGEAFVERPLVVSLDKRVNNGTSWKHTSRTSANTQTLADFIPDEHAVDPYAAAGEGEAAERVRWALSHMPERWRTILVLRHVSEWSLLQVGVVLGLSRERVRQIQVEADAAMRGILAGNDPGLPSLPSAPLMVHSYSQAALPLAKALARPPGKAKARTPVTHSATVRVTREPQPSVVKRQTHNTAARRRANLSPISPTQRESGTEPVSLFLDVRAASDGTPVVVTGKTSRNRPRLSSGEQGAKGARGQAKARASA